MRGRTYATRKVKNYHRFYFINNFVTPHSVLALFGLQMHGKFAAKRQRTFHLSWRVFLTLPCDNLSQALKSRDKLIYRRNASQQMYEVFASGLDKHIKTIYHDLSLD